VGQIIKALLPNFPKIITDDLGVLFKFVEQWDDEGCGFAAARSAADHDVSALQDIRDRLPLNGRRHVVTFVHHCFENWRD
jgi:hypothetical protein